MHQYIPPTGHFDMPFTWVFDPAALTDGQTYLNLFKYMQGGFGDFVLRRVVGIPTVLGNNQGELPPFGRYRLYDRYGNALSSMPLVGSGALVANAVTNVKGISPEELYPETGKIKFDLFNVNKAEFPVPQIAFQGVRRMKGRYPWERNLKARQKSFIYQQAVTIQGVAGTVPDVLMRQQIQDYDFELHELRLLRLDGMSTGSSGEGHAEITITARFGVPAFTVEIIEPLVPNAPFSFIVVPGISIQVSLSTNGLGTPMSAADLKAIWDADPAAYAMAEFTIDSLPNQPVAFIQPPVLIGGGTWTSLSDPIMGLWIRDANRVPIASDFMLDIYCDGNPNGLLRNGAIVPPLYYPKDQLLQIDCRSVLTNPNDAPVTVLIQMVGKQFIPC